MMQPNDVCRLKNVGTKEWKGTYNSQTYRAAPGGETIVPFIGVCNWFGHPDAVDGATPKEKYRTEEYLRLRTYYGVYDGIDGFTMEELWEQNVPKVEIHDLDGTRIITVVDNPEGTHLMEATQTINEKFALEQQLAQLQRQMETMKAMLDVQMRRDSALAQGDEVTDDLAPGPANPHVLTPEAIAEAEEQVRNQAAGTGAMSGPVQEEPSNLPVTEDAPTRVRVSSPS